MKRVRKAAIVESSGSEEDSDDSDFGETLRDKLKKKTVRSWKFQCREREVQGKVKD